jgi:hypothetical protein
MPASDAPTIVTDERATPAVLDHRGERELDRVVDSRRGRRS